MTKRQQRECPICKSFNYGKIGYLVRFGMKKKEAVYSCKICRYKSVGDK